jgi:hypothetical protein
MRWWPWGKPRPVQEELAQSREGRDRMAATVRKLDRALDELRAVTTELEAVTAERIERGGYGAH